MQKPAQSLWMVLVAEQFGPARKSSMVMVAVQQFELYLKSLARKFAGSML
jgi:hypothetical protein